MSSQAHFTVYGIFPRGCFSVCLIASVVVDREEWDRQKQTPTSSFCSHRSMLNPFAQGVCEQLIFVMAKYRASRETKNEMK